MNQLINLSTSYLWSCLTARAHTLIADSLFLKMRRQATGHREKKEVFALRASWNFFDDVGRHSDFYHRFPIRSGFDPIRVTYKPLWTLKCSRLFYTQKSKSSQSDSFSLPSYISAMCNSPRRDSQLGISRDSRQKNSITLGKILIFRRMPFTTLENP